MTDSKKYAFFLIITIVTLGGCLSTPPSMTQTALSFISASATLQNSSSPIFTATRLPNLTPPPTRDLPPLLTPRVTPFPTITLSEATENLMYMLRTNGDCKFPCFWGIHPDQTRYEELYSVIDNLGGYRFESLQENGDVRIGSNFRFEQNTQIFVELQANLQNDIVKDLKVTMGNLLDTGLTPEDWSVYSIDEILRTYGVPDRVELYFSGPSNFLSFQIRIKYENIRTFITYSAATNEINKYLIPPNLIFCPEEIGIDFVGLHIGEHPFDTGADGVPLSKATELDEQAFYKLFTENPSACLTIDIDAMP